MNAFKLLFLSIILLTGCVDLSNATEISVDRPAMTDHRVIMKAVYMNLNELKKEKKETKLQDNGVLSNANILNVTEVLTRLSKMKGIDNNTRVVIKKYIAWFKNYKSKSFSSGEQKIILQINKEIRDAKSFDEIAKIIERWKINPMVTQSKLLGLAISDLSACLNEEIALGEDGDISHNMPNWLRTVIKVAGADLFGAAVGGAVGALGASIIAAID